MKFQARFAAFCACLLALMLGSPVWAAGSRFEQTVAYVLQAEPEVRAGFVTAALDQLALAYDEEAALALQQARAAPDSAGLVSWAAAVQRYARQFDLLIDDVDSGFPVALTSGAGAPVAVMVAERTVMLTHPRPGYQTLYEQAVLEEFCLRYSCDEIGSAEHRANLRSVAGVPVRPLWGFSADGPVCSQRGLAVGFPATAPLAQARSFCAQWLQEAFALADEIAWQVRHGVRIEWNDLVIHPIPGRDGQRLQLNRVGDSVLATAPLIAAHPGTLAVLTPWLENQVLGDGQKVLQIDADQLGWQP